MTSIARMILPLPLLFLILSCSPGTSQSAAEKMKEEACSGDVAGFMSYIDKKQVSRSFSRMIRDNMKSLGSMDDQNKADVDKAVTAAVEKNWQAIEADIKKGKDSSFCRMKATPKKGLAKNEIMMESPEGGQLFFQLGKPNDKWIVISISNKPKSASAKREGEGGKAKEGE